MNYAIFVETYVHFNLWFVCKDSLLAGLHVHIRVRCAGREVLTATDMKNIMFWRVTPCSLVKVHTCFVGPHCLYLQDGGTSPASRQRVACDKFTRTSVRLHGVTSKRT
jgi:hypothetical protein